jgi:hypothetical protein
MKRLLYLVTLTLLMIVGSSVNVHAQSRDARSASARAAYGNNIPKFRSHTRKNAKAKKKARKSAKNKKDLNKKVPYRRGMPI